VVKDCPEHIEGCEPGTYISRERWGVVGVGGLLWPLVETMPAVPSPL